MKPHLYASLAETSPAEGDHPVDVAKLFREYNTALVRFTAAKLGSEHEAREVAQDAYVRLLQLDRSGFWSDHRAMVIHTQAHWERTAN